MHARIREVCLLQNAQCWTAGSRNASVLPVPVGAMPTTLAPESSPGHTCVRLERTIG